MIDLVYIVKDRKDGTDNMLTLSLRSVEKNLVNVRNIYLVTRYPMVNLTESSSIRFAAPIKWVKYMPVGDHAEWSKEDDEKNIIHKTLVACINPEISNPFLWMNNDYWILKETNAVNIPPYSDGSILARIKELSDSDSYRNRLKRTGQALEGAGLNTFDFDLHCPFLIDKNLFLSCMRHFPWWEQKCTIKSLYCNYAKLSNEYQKKDLKIKFGGIITDDFDKQVENEWILSCRAGVFDKLSEWLNNKFPEKCSYEK